MSVFIVIIDINLAAASFAFLTACMGDPMNHSAVQCSLVETNEVEKTEWS